MANRLHLLVGIVLFAACGGATTESTPLVAPTTVVVAITGSTVPEPTTSASPATTVASGTSTVVSTTTMSEPITTVAPGATSVAPVTAVVPGTTAVVPGTTYVVPETTTPIEGSDSCVMDGYDRWGRIRESAARPSASGWDILGADPTSQTVGYWGFGSGPGNSVEGGQVFGISGVVFADGMMATDNPQSASEAFSSSSRGSVALTPVVPGQGPSLDLNQPFTVAMRTSFDELRSAFIEEEGGGGYGVVEQTNPFITSGVGRNGGGDWTLGVEGFGCRLIVELNGPIYLADGSGSRLGGEQRLLVSDRMVGAGIWHDYILTVDNRSGRVGLSVDGADPEVWAVEPWEWETPSGEAALALTSASSESFDGSHDWVLVAQGVVDAAGVATRRVALEGEPGTAGGLLKATADDSGTFLSFEVGMDDWPAWQSVRIEEGWAQTLVLQEVRDRVAGDIDFVYVLHDNDVVPDTWQDWVGRFTGFSTTADGLGLPEIVLYDPLPIDGLFGIAVSPTDRFYHGLFLHESLHAWGQNVLPEVEPTGGGHWEHVAIEAALGGIGYVEDLGGGRYLRDLTWMTEEPMSSIPAIELYLMGLVGPDEVPPIEWYSEITILEETVAGTVITARKNVTTIEDIVDRFGPRVPDHTNSQRAFRGVVVMITPDGLSVEESVLLATEIEAFEIYFASVTGGRASIQLTGLTG
jgi:hypothetical protein